MSSLLARLIARRPSGLLCAGCDSDFLCPISWETDGKEYWVIEARCGECGLWHRLHLTNAEAAAWDVELDCQTQPIKRELRRLDRERMTREVERFIEALARDLIDAVDFA